MKKVCPLSLLPLLLFTSVYCCGQSDRCASLLNRSLGSRRNFLVTQEPKRNSPCITVVIKSLKAASDAESIKVLIHYLDFMDPKTAPIPGMGSSRRPDFPAVDTLFVIGKPAVPRLLSVIENTNSQVTEDNASALYSYIYREDLADGIRELNKRKEKVKPKARSRLKHTIQMLYDFCRQRTPDEAKKCEKEFQ